MSQFLDTDSAKLERVRDQLEERGFTFGFLHGGVVCSDCPTLTLEVRRRETHSVESYRARERELCEVARAHGVETYWGTLPERRDLRTTW